MALGSEVYQIDVVRVLQPLMDLVCRHLDGVALYNLSNVCKEWRCVALCERDKRYYAELLRFHSKISNLASILGTNPNISLLIYDSKLEKSLQPPLKKTDWARQINVGISLREFEEQLSNKTLVLRVDEYLTNEVADLHDYMKQQNSKLTRNCDVLGLFLLSAKERVQVHVAYIEPNRIMNVVDIHRDRDSELAYIRLAEELGLDNCKNSQTTIIQIDSSNLTALSDIYKIVTKLRKRAEDNGKEVVLARLAGTMLFTGDRDHNRSNWYTSLLLRISGPRVESWSTFIHANAGREEVERRLLALKEKVKRKRHYIGLLFTPKCTLSRCSHINHICGDSRELMKCIKLIFPDIRFVGTFNPGNFSYSSRPQTDSFDEIDVYKPGFDHMITMYLSIIIILQHAVRKTPVYYTQA